MTRGAELRSAPAKTFGFEDAKRQSRLASLSGCSSRKVEGVQHRSTSQAAISGGLRRVKADRLRAPLLSLTETSVVEWLWHEPRRELRLGWHQENQPMVTMLWSL